MFRLAFLRPSILFHPAPASATLILSCAMTILLPTAPAVAEERITILTPDAVQYRTDSKAPDILVAVVAGDPQNGFYTLRVKFPRDVKTPPHFHPDTRTVTVISGIYYFGEGTVFAADKMQGYGPGTVIVVPAGKPHFSWARDGEVIIHEAGIGPTGVTLTDH